MARFPGAQWRPVPWANAIKRRRGYTSPRIAVFHIAVSQRTTKSLYGFFTGAGKGSVCSHMFVDDYGGAEQYIDSKKRSSADYTGGDYTFSIETAGGRGDDLKEGWSPEALETLAQITAWLHLDEGIPLRLVKTSKPTESGFGWHALGVPATYAQKNRGISQTGGELWSGAVGKVCPGAARIAQIPGIIERAKEIVADGSKPVTGSRPGMSVPTPIPAPKPKPVATVSTRKIQQDLNTYARAGLVVDGVNGPVTKAWRTWVADAQRTHLPAWKGVPKLVVDGHYGPIMANAVKTLQRRNGLVVDGVLGPITIAFMRRHGSKIKNRPKNRP